MQAHLYNMYVNIHKISSEDHFTQKPSADKETGNTDQFILLPTLTDMDECPKVRNICFYKHIHMNHSITDLKQWVCLVAGPGSFHAQLLHTISQSAFRSYSPSESWSGHAAPSSMQVLHLSHSEITHISVPKLWPSKSVISKPFIFLVGQSRLIFTSDHILIWITPPSLVATPGITWAPVTHRLIMVTGILMSTRMYPLTRMHTQNRQLP